MKKSEEFNRRLGELVNDIETKVAVLLMRNPMLRKQEFGWGSEAKYNLSINEHNGVRYVDAYDGIDHYRFSILFTTQEMIEILEQMENYLEENK